MNRRSFLAGCLAAAAAPAIVRADSLMRVIPRETSVLLDDYEEGVWIPTLTGTHNTDGTWSHEPTAAYMRCGKIVMVSSRSLVPAHARAQWAIEGLTAKW